MHDGPAAWTWTRRLGARAATLGRHIALSRAESGSSSPAGQALLAHELTHVVQQGTGLSPVVPQRATPEGEADDVSAESASSGGGGLGPPIELSDGTTIQLLTTAATVEERIPPWAPHELRRAILDGTLAPGVHRFPGRSPWGDIVVQVSAQSSRTRIEMYQEFPSDMDFYTGVAQGRAGVAHILFDAYTAYNKDMAYFVEGKGLPPGEARDRLREINEEVFRLVIEASATIMASGAGVSAIASSQTALVGAVERSGFSSVRSRPSGATAEQRAALDTLSTAPVPRGRVPREEVAAAQKALSSGSPTKEQLVLLLKDATDQAWDFIASVARWQGQATARPTWEVMQNACGLGSRCTTASLVAAAREAGHPVTVRQFQAGELLWGSGGGVHTFTTVDFGDVVYLVDTTFAQFVRREGGDVVRGANIRATLNQDPALAELGTALMRDGFVELDDVAAGLYARALDAVGEQVVTNERTSAASTAMAGRILDGSGAYQVEVSGTGQAGPSPALHESVVELLGDADAAMTFLAHAGKGSELREGLERLLDRLYQLE